MLVLFYGTFWLLSCGGIDREELSNALFPAIVSGGVAYTICQSVVTMTDWSVHNPIVAIIYGIVFLLVYMVSLRVLFTNVLVELINYLPANRTIGRFLFFAQNPA